MHLLTYLRIELSRLTHERTTLLLLMIAALCTLFGYSLSPPAGTGTTAALVLANPLLSGAAGGMLLFAVFTLYTMNRSQRNYMNSLLNSITSPLLTSIVQTLALLLLAIVSSLLTALIYLPITQLLLKETFMFNEYTQFVMIFLMPALMMGVLIAAIFYQFFQRTDLSFLCFLLLFLIGLGPWNQDTYLLYWIDLSSLGFSSDLGNTSIFRMALYSRWLWLCLFSGSWLISLLCVRVYEKNLFKSLIYHLRKSLMGCLALGLIVYGLFLYDRQPYMDHELPMTLETGGNTSGEMSIMVKDEETDSSLIVRHTDFDLTLDVQNGSLSGTARYTLENISGDEQDCLLDIAPGYTVDHITVNGESIPFTDLDNDQYILFKNISLRLPADAQMEVVITYHGIAQVPANTGMLMLYYEITPEYINLGGSHVLPTFQNAMSENCTFEGRITLPSELELITSGQTPKKLRQEGAQTIWNVSGNGLRPVIFGGNYVCMKIDDVGFPVFFCYSQNHQTEFEELDIHSLLQETLTYCANTYGSLTYTEDYPLNIVMSSAHMMGGGASDNLSFMGETFFSAANLEDLSKGADAAEVIVHEIIHQWWGIERYMCDDENTDWSSEALTCYTTYRLMKALKGEAYAQQFYVDVWEAKVEALNRNFYVRNPQYLAMLPEEHQTTLSAMIFDANTYAKAPLQILKAEQLVGGEEAMDKILRKLFTEGGTEMAPFITWQDFLDACGLSEEQLVIEGGNEHA